VSRPKRRLGQHFLHDPRILDRLAEALGATPADTVLEIGPGPGGLTEALLRHAGRVIAIEKDPEIIPALRERVPGATIIEGDALTQEWVSLVGGPGGLVTGNIPYNITSPLLDKALTPPRPRRIVFLVQKEVARRVGAHPGDDDYGALTVGIQAVAKTEVLFTVPAGAFHPVPKVDSAALRLEPLAEPLVADDEVRSFRVAVVGLFGFRRKQLMRAVRQLTGWDGEAAGRVVAAAGLDPAVRPEVLSPAEFLRLHAALVDGGWRPT
jgi:16S rRNA (adenine1518-N6/adenine1519-N6)-dimethyltransferase